MSVCDLIKSKLRIPVTKADISTAHRYGRKNDGKVRPLLVEFVHVWRRDEVFYKKSALNNSKIVVSEFLTSGRYRLFKTVREKFGNDCWTKNGRIVFKFNNRLQYVTNVDEFESIVNN